jgi:HSP20 family molecular chaperone IbpA
MTSMTKRHALWDGFDELFTSAFGKGSLVNLPLYTVSAQTTQHTVVTDAFGDIVVEIEAPGASKENVSVSLSDGCVVVEWRHGGKDRRSIQFVGEDAILDGAKARVKDGIVLVELKTRQNTPARPDTKIPVE